jgi:hypothetical protein
LSPGLRIRTDALMFVGWTCVDVALAFAESTEDEPVGAGAVMVTSGTGFGAVPSVPSSGPIVVDEVPSPGVLASTASSLGPWSVMTIWPFDAL